MAAGTSTILTSATRHCTPNAPEPSLVIRLTTCAAGSDGGMIGAGGGVCAIDWVAPVNVVSAIAPAMAFRIVSSRYYFAIKNVSRMSEQQTARRNRSQQAAAAAWRRYLPSGAFRLESAKWAKADIEPIIPDDRI